MSWGPAAVVGSNWSLRPGSRTPSTAELKPSITANTISKTPANVIHIRSYRSMCMALPPHEKSAWPCLRQQVSARFLAPREHDPVHVTPQRRDHRSIPQQDGPRTHWRFDGALGTWL